MVAVKNKINAIKTVAMHNVFNRTSVFEPIQDSKQKIDVERNYTYKDTQYKLSILGPYLNHTVDYPLLALIIHLWKNNLRCYVINPGAVVLSLDVIKETIGVAGKGTRRAEYKKIELSLNRLSRLQLGMKNDLPIKEVEVCGSLIENNYVINFEEKVIKVEIGIFLEFLYKPNRDITYMNIERMISINNECSKALYKFLSSQSSSFIDFKYDKLCKVLGLSERNINDSKRREYLVKALRFLENIKVLWCFRVNGSTYRVIQSKHYKEKESEFILNNAVSNLIFKKR